MKRILKITLAVAVALVLLVFASLGVFLGFNQNSIISWKLSKDLETKINNNTSMEVLDTARTCGKISGNGNGMEFYCAVLVKSDSEEDVAKLVSSMGDDYDIVGYYVQTHKEIDMEPIGGHIFLEYDSFPNDGSTYYTVYYLTTHKFSTDFDIKAH